MAGQPEILSAEIAAPPLSLRPVSVGGVSAMPVGLERNVAIQPAPPAELATVTAESSSDWKKIQVPGEWVMQGFSVERQTPAAYFRTFSVAAKPAGQRWKLRFSAVYSLCRVWVNARSWASMRVASFRSSSTQPTRSDRASIHLW